MPEMKSLRSFVLRTLTGHMVKFTADEVTNVPQAAVQAALEAGCALTNESDRKSHEESSTLKVDFRGNVRESLIFLAVKAIAEKNDIAEFNSGGIPKESAVGVRLGMNNVSQKEVTALYEKYKSSINGGEPFTIAPDAQNAMRVIEASESAELKLLAEEFGVEEIKGLSAKDLRRKLLATFTGSSK